jgi:hypothetical protein
MGHNISCSVSSGEIWRRLRHQNSSCNGLLFRCLVAQECLPERYILAVGVGQSGEHEHTCALMICAATARPDSDGLCIVSTPPEGIPEPNM